MYKFVYKIVDIFFPKPFDCNNIFPKNITAVFDTNYVVEPINIIINVIQNITSEAILEGNAKISSITKINQFNLNPTLCSVYANSLHRTIPFGLGLTKNSNIMKLEYKMSRMHEIIKLNDRNNFSCIYTFYVFQREILNLDCYWTKYFPAHCFGLIKIAPNKYVLTQTYEDEFDHTKYIDILNLKSALDLCEMIVHLCDCEIIDQKFIDYWNIITRFNVSYTKGFNLKNQTKQNHPRVYFSKFIYCFHNKC